MRGDHLSAHPATDLSGEIDVPGDKSISHRALILAAMAEGESRIQGLSEGLDVRATLEAVRALGAEVREAEDGSWLVSGGPWRSPPEPIDCGNSGTTARLLMGAAAGRLIRVTLTGDASLRRRPMTRVAGPLRAMGAGIEGGDTLPLTVSGGALRPIRHVNLPASAQVKSVILLAGLSAAGLVEVEEPLPSRDHTELMLAAFGAKLGGGGGAGAVSVSLHGPQLLSATTVQVPGDFSSAAFPLVAALLVPGSAMTVRDVGLNPLRTGLLETLREMGADIAASNSRMCGGEPVADLTARTSRLRGVTVAADRAPRMIDEYPILAAAAACAQGETVMHGLSELRHKESDRLAGLVEGLTACGVQAQAEGDTLRILGGVVRGGASIDSRGDHRIAMSFLVLGLASAAAVRVDGAAMIATSFPGFAELMGGLGARIEQA